jgi:cation transport ATPase
VSYYRSLLCIDGAILIGGGRSTFIAGLIALSRKISLVPVANFGGGTERVWSYMCHQPNFATEGDLSGAAAGWTPTSATVIVKSIVDQCHRRAEIENRIRCEQHRVARNAARSLTIGLCLLLLALAIIPASYASRPGTTEWITLLLAAPLFAAMCGAIIRNAFDESQGWLRATTLGAAAGFVAFLLFVAAQLTASPSILSIDSARRLLFVVIPVAFTAGLTFDAVYNKLRSQDVVRASTPQDGDPQ